MINENNKINPGELKVIDNAIPKLQAGKYTLRTKQTVQLKDGNTDSFVNDETTFEVAAPRFSLEPAVIYSEYPGRDSKGSFSNTLPNVVFMRKTLLWERTISDKADKEIPWMALLLFEEDELKEKNILLQSLVLDDIFNKKVSNVLYPDIKPNSIDQAELDKYKVVSNETPRYNIIDVPCPLLHNILPYESELKYLAHARQVDTSDKEKPDTNAKGWFSVLIGNRLPGINKRHVAVVVSLEGHKEHLDGKKLAEPDNANKLVRLVVLHSWQFTSQGEDFQMLVENIDRAAGPLKMDVDEQKVKNDTILRAFKYGYTALNHQMRNGADSVSWYRGPLVPVQIPRPDLIDFQDGDAALLFDDDTAMFDISYASAWQVGRLLGLQSPAYMNAIHNWKKNFERDTMLNLATDLMKTTFKDSFSFDEAPQSSKNGNTKKLFKEAVSTAESDDLLNSLLGELWSKKIKNNG